MKKILSYIFKQKCNVHPTLIKAAIGGKRMARIVNKLDEEEDDEVLHSIRMMELTRCRENLP